MASPCAYCMRVVHTPQCGGTVEQFKICSWAESKPKGSYHQRPNLNTSGCRVVKRKASLATAASGAACLCLPIRDFSMREEKPRQQTVAMATRGKAPRQLPNPLLTCLPNQSWTKIPFRCAPIHLLLTVTVTRPVGRSAARDWMRGYFPPKLQQIIAKRLH